MVAPVIVVVDQAHEMRFEVAGQQTADVTAARLLSISKDLPHDWHAQWRHLGFAIV